MMFQPPRIKITLLKVVTPSAPNTVAPASIQQRERTLPILLLAGEVGDIFPRFLYGGRSERQTGRPLGARNCPASSLIQMPRIAPERGVRGNRSDLRGP